MSKCESIERSKVSCHRETDGTIILAGVGRRIACSEFRLEPRALFTLSVEEHPVISSNDVECFYSNGWKAGQTVRPIKESN